MEKLHFYTTGEGFTNLLNDYYSSGLFDLFDKLLGDNLDEDQKKLAFRLRMELTGTTQNGGDLSCHFHEKDTEDFPEKLYYAVKTSIRGILNEDIRELDWIIEQEEEEGAKNIRVLLKYIPADEILQICKKYILREHGYEVSEYPDIEDGFTISGVITKDGSFIQCGYMDHINLFSILYSVGMSDAPDWTDSKEVIHISSSQVGGTPAFYLGKRHFSRENKITEEQIKTLWRIRKWASETRDLEDNKVASKIRRHCVLSEKNGGKYGNLIFLQKFYPEVKLPKFSKELMDFQGSEKVFIRTSPEHSLPGLLNSRIIDFSEDSYQSTVSEIESEFERFKDIRKGNEIHWFVQELLEGINGVCHIRKEPNCSDQKYTFGYQISETQGDVVNGRGTSDKLPYVLEKELLNISESIFKDLNQGVQLEFVISENQVYIVQLRVLENEFETALGSRRPESTIYEGITFSKGSEVDLPIEDILIVKEDAMPVDLLGKKALIVENNSEFSHIMALAKTLEIPAIYGTGPIDLKGIKTLNMSAITKEGYIYL